MITLLHGDNIEASREALNRMKLENRDKDIRSIDGRTVDGELLTQSLESHSLFGGMAVIIIEQLFGKLGRQIKRIREYSELLERAGRDQDIIIWESKEVSASVTRQLGSTVSVQVFNTPVIIFQFLDTMRLDVFEKLMETEAPELVFSMLVKRVRQLMEIASGSTLQGLADWQVGRLTTQAKSFTMNELISLYKKLGDAEYKVKSGTSAFGMRQLLEQILIEV